MSDGWLFRLRTSLGAGRSAPAWPEPGANGNPELPSLRRVPASVDPAPEVPSVPEPAGSGRDE